MTSVREKNFQSLLEATSGERRKYPKSVKKRYQNIEATTAINIAGAEADNSLNQSIREHLINNKKIHDYLLYEREHIRVLGWW